MKQLPPISFGQMGLALSLAAAAFVAALAPAQSDTFWQLRAGHETLSSGTVPLTETYSHTAFGAPWPNHSWLWQVVAFSLHRLGGFPVLALVNAVAAVSALALSLGIASGRARTRAIVLLITIPLVAPAWSLRPQVASMLFFTLLLWALARGLFLWIPLVMLGWANFHGAVALGGVAMLATSLYAVVAAIQTREGGDVGRARKAIAAMAASAAMTLLTPMGLSLWSYVVESIARSRENEIDEWKPALNLGIAEVWFWVWLLGVLVVVYLRRDRLDRARDGTTIAVALALVPLAASAVRNIPFLAIAAVPVLLAAARSRGSDPEGPDPRRQAHTWAVLGASTLLALAVAALWSQPSASLGWRPVSTAIVRAVEGCPGPLYNEYNEGGYLIWSAPRVPVFIDSRQDPYPQQLLDRAIETQTSGEYRELFSDYRVACAALPTDSPTAAALIHDGWAVEASDGAWSVLYWPGAGVASQ